MTKEIVRIKLTDEFKEEAMDLIKNTIKKVLNVHGVELSAKEKRAIKNFSLDQLNVNVTNRINSKTLWVFNIENSIPVLVERDKGIPKLGNLISKSKEKGTYLINSNLTWSISKKNDDKGGLSREEFEKAVLDMTLEDLETAAFYGTLSYVGDKNV